MIHLWVANTPANCVTVNCMYFVASVPIPTPRAVTNACEAASEPCCDIKESPYLGEMGDGGRLKLRTGSSGAEERLLAGLLLGLLSTLVAGLLLRLLGFVVVLLLLLGVL